VTDLFAADLQRILWRQMTWLIGGIGFLIVAAAGVITFVHTANHHQLFATRTDLRAAVAAAVIPLAFAGYTLGASGLGADYTSRALTTLLTWEPRRRLVLASRACACALVTGGLTVAMLLAFIVALLPSAIVHGTGGVPDGAWYLSMAAMTLRCVLFTAAMSIIGVSAAAIGRSTTAAVIGIVLYLVLIENAAFEAVPSVAGGCSSPMPSHGSARTRTRPPVHRTGTPSLPVGCFWPAAQRPCGRSQRGPSSTGTLRERGRLMHDTDW
jgi:hypothetical protein